MYFSRKSIVGFIYGTCEPPFGTDGGCPSPLTIASHPACEQPHSLYTRYSAGGTPAPHDETRIRGVPAAIFDERPYHGRSRLEVYTGDARVVIEGDDAELVMRAADEMVAPSTSPGGAKRPQTDLPRPIRGAVDHDARENPQC
jgi:hypothetical protein